MAEDTQEDLSMEDILSSIKDILLEDNEAQNQNAKLMPEAPQAPAIAAAKPETDVVDDVLTLSPAMIVETRFPATEPDAPVEVGADPLDLDFEHEFENLPNEPILDDVEAEVLSKMPVQPTIEEDPLDLSDFSIKDSDDLNLDSETDSDTKISFSDLSFDEPIVDVEAEPIYSTEDDLANQESFSPILEDEADDSQSLESLLDDETLTAILEAQPSEAELIEEPKEKISEFSLAEDFVEPTDNVYEAVVAEDIVENEIKNPSLEASAEPEIEIEPEIIIEPELVIPVMDEIEPISAPEPIVPPELKSEIEPVENISEEAVDISAGIISNFAKMFAETQKEKSAFDKEATPSQLANQTMSEIELGDGSLTIEEIVRDVVVEIVEKNLKTDFDFAATASAEIAKQTRAWLSVNLPSIVEAAVRKEIERVMAKVSS